MVNDLNIRIVSALGDIVQTWPLQPELGHSTISLDWDGVSAGGRELPSGMYQVIVTDGVHQKAWRLIKQ